MFNSTPPITPKIIGENFPIVGGKNGVVLIPKKDNAKSATAQNIRIDPMYFKIFTR